MPLSMLFPLGAVPRTLLFYFQQIRPLANCSAEDGRVVGHMLHDLVRRKPKDLPHAIREFVNRTAMLRGCGFAHIGDMLARLLTADVQADVRARPEEGTTATPSAPVPTTTGGLDPSLLTKEQAIAIATAIVLSLHEHGVPAAGLKRVVKSHAALRAMESEYAWFVPMLEVILASKAAEPRRSTYSMKRLRSRIQSVAPSKKASNADGADEESSFSPVVRLGAQESHHCYCVRICREYVHAQRLPLFLHTHGCLHRCLGMRMMREMPRCQLQPLRRRARLRKACDVSTVARRCRSSTECLFAAMPELYSADCLFVCCYA